MEDLNGDDCRRSFSIRRYSQLMEELNGGDHRSSSPIKRGSQLFSTLVQMSLSTFYRLMGVWSKCRIVMGCVTNAYMQPITQRHLPLTPDTKASVTGGSRPPIPIRTRTRNHGYPCSNPNWIQTAHKLAVKSHPGSSPRSQPRIFPIAL